MFGTDWSVLARTEDAEEFFHNLSAPYAARFGAGDACRFLGDNAARYLGLYPGGKTRERLAALSDERPTARAEANSYPDCITDIVTRWADF